MDSDCTGGHIAMQFDTASQNNIISNISTVYEESNAGLWHKTRSY